MTKTQRTWMAWLAAAVLIVVGFYQYASSRYVEGNLIEARNNLRAMLYVLYQFDADYGAFPNAETAKRVVEDTESKLRIGAGSSNEIFRQLISAGSLDGEKVFFARIPGAREPDNDFSRPDGVLAKGEVGYSYILGKSSRSSAETPLVLTPLVPGTNRFDPKPFNGRALVMRVGSISTGIIYVLPINSRGEVIDSSGKHLLDAAHPLWQGKAPVILWPE